MIIENEDRGGAFLAGHEWQRRKTGTASGGGQTLFPYAQRTPVGKGFASHTCTTTAPNCFTPSDFHYLPLSEVFLLLRFTLLIIRGYICTWSYRLSHSGSNVAQLPSSSWYYDEKYRGKDTLITRQFLLISSNRFCTNIIDIFVKW